MRRISKFVLPDGQIFKMWEHFFKFLFDLFYFCALAFLTNEQGYLFNLLAPNRQRLDVSLPQNYRHTGIFFAYPV